MDGITRPYLVGISGGSAAGKTFLLAKLLNHFSTNDITLISQDNYYKKKQEQQICSDGGINFDHPDALYLDRFADDLKRLSVGENVEIDEYTFNNPQMPPRRIRYEPAPILLVEGLFVFHHPETAKQLDLRIFVDADEHIKLARRIQRDAEERGYPVDEVLEMYRQFVVPMYRRFVEPYKFESDLILHNNSHIDKALSVLIDHLQAELQRRV